MKLVIALLLTSLSTLALAEKSGDGPGNSLASTQPPVVITGKPLAKGKIRLSGTQIIKMESETKGAVSSTTIVGEVALSGNGISAKVPVNQTTQDVLGTIEIAGQNVVETDAKGKVVVNKILRNDTKALVYEPLKQQPIDPIIAEDGTMVFSKPVSSPTSCLKLANGSMQCEFSVSADAKLYSNDDE